MIRPVRVRLLVLSALLVAALAVSPALLSAGMSIGVAAWGGAWEPTWINGKSKMPMGIPTGGSNTFTPMPISLTIKPFDVPPAVLYGPSLSFKFTERIGISSVFLYGQFKAVSTGPFPSIWGLIAYSRYYKSITKFDSDTSLGFEVTRNLKLIAGFKYQGYDYVETHRYLNVSYNPGGGGGGMYAPRAKDRMRSLGPAVGIGLNVHLVENLYLQCNFTASLLFGSEVYRFKHNYYYLTSQTNPFQYNRYFASLFRTVGGNGTVALAYLVDRANITLSLGFRYQALYYLYDPGKTKKYYELFRSGGSFDHFYGALAAVTYSISFTGKRGS